MAEPSKPTGDKSSGSNDKDDKTPDASNAPDKKADDSAKGTSPDSKKDDKKFGASTTVKPANPKSSSSAGSAKSSSVPGSGPAKPAGATAKAPGNGSGGSLALKLIIVIVVIAGAAFATKNVWLPSVQPLLAKVPGLAPSQPSPSIRELTTRLNALEQKVQDGDAQQGLQRALNRIADLESRLAEVRQLAQSMSSNGEVDLSPLMRRLDNVEQAGRDTASKLQELTNAQQSAGSGEGRASALVLSLAQLRDAALSGQPFASQLNAFQALARGDGDLVTAASKLADDAGDGLPTAAELRRDFGAIAGDIVAIARTSDGDWLDQAAGRLSTLVSVRRTDGQSGDPVEDAVAEIENRLAAGNVIGAVDAASQLSNAVSTEPQGILEPWLLKASARAEAEKALNDMQASALAGLGN